MAPTLTFTQALAQAETQARTKLPDELHERLTLSRIRKVRGGTADQVNRFSSHYLSRGSKSFRLKFARCCCWVWRSSKPARSSRPMTAPPGAWRPAAAPVSSTGLFARTLELVHEGSGTASAG